MDAGVDVKSTGNAAHGERRGQRREMLIRSVAARSLPRLFIRLNESWVRGKAGNFQPSGAKSG